MKRNGAYFDEELAPCGMAGLTMTGGRHPFRDQAPDLSDCLVARPKPFRLVIWEPLLTKAPSPALASAYCCYLHTVIFYHRPYIVRPWTRFYRGANGRLRPSRGGFEQWDQIETRLMHDDVVDFQGERFEVGGGWVIWSRRRWWMRRGARRCSGEKAA